jgi:hypothetical protein
MYKKHSHCRVHKSLTLVSILAHLIPVLYITTNFYNLHLKNILLHMPRSLCCRFYDCNAVLDCMRHLPLACCILNSVHLLLFEVVIFMTAYCATEDQGVPQNSCQDSCVIEIRASDLPIYSHPRLTSFRTYVVCPQTIYIKPTTQIGTCHGPGG